MGLPQEATTNYQAALQLAEYILTNDTANPDATKLRLTCRIKIGLEKTEIAVSKISLQSQALDIGLKAGDVLISYNDGKQGGARRRPAGLDGSCHANRNRVGNPPGWCAAQARRQRRAVGCGMRRPDCYEMRTDFYACS